MNIGGTNIITITNTLKPSKLKKAAVLIFIYNHSIVFIKRNKNLKIHPGEVSFPGGTFDQNFDTNLLDTALRETEEEIGIRKDEIEILGKMKEFETLVTHIKVTPFIGKSRKDKLNFKICRDEVEKTIIVPIKHLLDNRYKVVVPLKFKGKIFLNTFYYFNNNLIWGATSRILDNFLNDKKTLNQILS